MIEQPIWDKIREYLKCEDYREKCPHGTNLDAVVLYIRKELHETGYPFIEVFGWEDKTKTLYNLGWHDHFLVQKEPVNIDSFGENLVHIYPWKDHESWQAVPMYCSTLELTEKGTIR